MSGRVRNAATQRESSFGSNLGSVQGYQRRFQCLQELRKGAQAGIQHLQLENLRQLYQQGKINLVSYRRLKLKAIQAHEESQFGAESALEDSLVLNGLDFVVIFK